MCPLSSTKKMRQTADPKPDFPNETLCGGYYEAIIARAQANRQRSVEIMELRVLGQVQVLSSSEHLG